MGFGSGIFAKRKAKREHLALNVGGLEGEVAKLRADTAKALEPMASIAIQDWVNPLAPAAAGLEAATATTVAPRVVTSFLAPGATELKANPRNLTFTTAGGTPADAPANAVITGKDVDGKVITETVALSQTAATVQGVKAFASVTSVAYEAAEGAGATISIGYGSKFGLRAKLKARGGLAAPVREVANGAVVTTGTFVDETTSAPYGTYTPATAPDGTKSYAIYFESVPKLAEHQVSAHAHRDL